MSVAPDHAEVVREVTQHIIDFVEQPHPKLGNLPVCPFARKARLENRIQFEVLELTREGILALVTSFLARPEIHLMICIHPRRDGLSSAEVGRLAETLNQTLQDMNLLAIGLHPEDSFNIDGLYTRREPYPSIQIIRLDVGEAAHQSIKNTGYYDRWTGGNLRDCMYSQEEILVLAPNHTEIVREFTQHIVDFVEQPHLKLGSLPVCPFARKARRDNRIQFEVLKLAREGILALLPSFMAKPEFDIMICIHPRKCGLSFAEVQRLVEEFNETLPAMNLMALGGHPEDPFNIDGLYTRREPYPNIQLIRLDVGERAHQSIKNSGYYARWTESNLRDVTPDPRPRP